MTSDGYGDLLDRRNFLALAGASGAAALVGAAGSAGAQSDDATPPGVFDVTHRGVTGANPADVQWNMANAANAPQISHHLLFEKFGQWSYAEGDFRPAGVSEWSDTGDAFELTIREGLTWSNGDAVTADDVVTQLRLEEHDGDPMWDWAESVETVDDRTVRVRKSGSVNPNLVEFDVLHRYLFADEGTYGEKLSAIEDGGDLSEYTGFEDDDPVTNGPFALSSRDQQTMLTERNPDSPWADGVNFQEYRLEAVSGNQGRQQALVSLLVDSDYSVAVPQDVVEQMPDAVEGIEVPNVFGVGLTPNHADPIAGDRAVRQAIAYVANREEAVRNSLPASKRAPEIPTGISTAAQERWLGDEMATFESYGKDQSMTDAAATVLEDAGYAKSDGSWQTPEGEDLSITLSHPPGWSDWILALESVAQNLNDFGIDASVSAVSNYTNARENGEFQFIAQTWLHNSPSTYPYYSLLHQLLEHQSFPVRDGYPPAVEARGGSEAAVSVPARDGDGEVVVHVDDRLTDLATTSDETRAEEIVRELAWVANQDLPQIPISEKLLQQWITTDDWVVPDDVAEDPDANVQWAPTWLPRKGKLEYDGTVQQTLEVLTPDGSVPRGETAEVALRLASVPAGVDDFAVEVSLGDPSAATFVDATVGESFEGTWTSTEDGTVRIEGSDPDDLASAGARDVRLGTVRLAGTAVAETSVDVAVESFASDTGDEVRTTVTPASVVVASSGLEEVDGVVPIDLDGDGRHEDVNANARGDIADAVELFRHRNDGAVTDHASAYDFNDSGDVTIGDAVALFRENVS